MVLQHVKANKNYKDCDCFLEKYFNNNDNLKMFYIFLQRALDISNFVSRRIFISQNIPENWKELSIEGPDRVRRKFSDEKITVV